MPPFSPGDRLIVLGAGATRGARFAAEAFTPMCDPPLNADFFTQLQRITGPVRRRQLVEQVIKDVVGLFGANFSLTLEDYFTQLEFLAEAIKLAPPGGGGLTASELRDNRERLLAAVSLVLEVSTDAAIRTAGGCEYHERMVQHLAAKDTIISFNYDCVVDHALRRSATGVWSAKYGYALPKPDRIAGHQFWDAQPPASASTKTAYLLKLHGSLNWQLPPATDPDGQIKLKQRLHTQFGVPRFTIIPPVWNKAVADDPIFRTIWTNAERAIRAARHIAVVGFSFVPTDLPVESLFRVALAKDPALKTLVIANPSGEHRRRVREVFAKSLERGAVVRQYDSFSDFVGAFPECLGG
jgi:SIR2-like domain